MPLAACVGCSFNLPKTSAKAIAVEALESVTRLLDEVPLSSDERATAEGDMAALDAVLAKLRDMPALDGRIPRSYTTPIIVRLDERSRHMDDVVAPEDIRDARSSSVTTTVKRAESRRTGATHGDAALDPGP